MIVPHRKRWPKIHETAFVAPSADIIGEVEIGEKSSVWFQCVLRGDVSPIKIGSRSNIQDHTMIHATRQLSQTVIGDEVTVGHRVTLHGCKIGNRVLVGMGAIILDNAEIGDECIVGAGALVTKNTIIPPRSLVIGAPGESRAPFERGRNRVFEQNGRELRKRLGRVPGLCPRPAPSRRRSSGIRRRPGGLFRRRAFDLAIRFERTNRQNRSRRGALT